MIYRLLVLLLTLFAFSQQALAEKEVSGTYQEFQQEIIRLKNANQIRDTVIKNLIRRIEAVENSGKESRKSEQKTVDQVVKDRYEAEDPEIKARMQMEAEENYNLIQTAFEQRVGREGGMLLSPYRFVYEPSISYAHASYDSIVIDGFTIFPVLVIGDIVAERVRRDIVTSNHSFRIGLPLDMQFDLIIPFGYERERSFRDDGTHEIKDTNGLGDISLALSHQIVKHHSFWPDTLIGISWKSKTGEDPYRLIGADELSLGSGFETWGASLTTMTAADPIVLFAGLSATYTPGEDKDIGHVKPGESYGLNLGMALSLNLDTSLSFNYQYRYTKETDIEKQKIDGSDLTTSTFAIGLSKAQSDRFTTDIDLGIGLTSDSPDFQLTVSFPFSFSLKGNE